MLMDGNQRIVKEGTMRAEWDGQATGAFRWCLDFWLWIHMGWGLEAIIWRGMEHRLEAFTLHRFGFGFGFGCLAYYVQSFWAMATLHSSIHEILTMPHDLEYDGRGGYRYVEQIRVLRFNHMDRARALGRRRITTMQR